MRHVLTAMLIAAALPSAASANILKDMFSPIGNAISGLIFGDDPLGLAQLDGIMRQASVIETQLNSDLRDRIQQATDGLSIIVEDADQALSDRISQFDEAADARLSEVDVILYENLVRLDRTIQSGMYELKNLERQAANDIHCATVNLSEIATSTIDDVIALFEGVRIEGGFLVGSTEIKLPDRNAQTAAQRYRANVRDIQLTLNELNDDTPARIIVAAYSELSRLAYDAACIYRQPDQVTGNFILFNIDRQNYASASRAWAEVMTTGLD